MLYILHVRLSKLMLCCMLDAHGMFGLSDGLKFVLVASQEQANFINRHAW